MKRKGSEHINVHRELIDQCREGNRQAQFAIYKLYYRAMYNTCIRIVGNRGEAEDVMQESFLAAFNKLGSYSGKVSFGAWLKKIVVNKSLDHLRKQKMLFESIDDDHIHPIADQPAGEKEKEAEPDYNLERIRQAIESLPDGYRIVLSLYLLEGYDHDEIAEITGIAPSTARSQYARARKRLAELLKKKLKKMTELKKIIRSNRDAFDRHEPPAGHFERFRNKLAGSRTIHRSFTGSLMRVAALVVLVLGLTYMVHRLTRPAGMQNILAEEQAGMEYIEAERYYSSMIDNRFEQIENMKGFDQEQKQLLLEEIKEMDKVYQGLKKDLEMTRDDERVISAIIAHYQMKLEVMNRIMTKLEQLQDNKKDQENEKMES